MMSRAILAVLVAMLGGLSSVGWAQSCGPVPTTIGGVPVPVVAGTNQLQIGNNGEVTNGTTTVPATGNGTSVSTSSGVQPPGQSLSGFVPSTFPSVGTADVTVNNSTLATGVYDDVTIRNTSTFSGGTYYMQTISGDNGVTLNMAAGDYFVESFTSGNNFTINVTSGPVRIFVKTLFQPGNDPNLNVGGNAANLQVFLYSGATLQFGTNTNFVGLIYSPSNTTTIQMGNNATITGAVLGGGVVQLGNNTDLVFDPATQAAIASIDSCGLLGDWRMDEIVAWNGTASEVRDSSGKGYHGTAVAGATTASASPAYTSSGNSTCGYGYFDRTGTLKTYITLPTVPKMTSSFTLVAWIRSTASTSQHQRIFVNDDNDNGWALSLADGTNTSIIRLFNRNVSFSGVSGGSLSAGNVAIDTPAVISNNTWYYVAASIDTTKRTATVYVYNVAGTQLAKTSASYTGTWCASGTCTGTTAIGGETSASSEGAQNSWHFLGNIDEARLFRSALPQADVASALTRVRTCPSAGPNHIRVFLNNDATALTCTPRAVDAIACADSTCTTRYGSIASVTLAPNGTSANIPANGTGTPSVSYTSVGTQGVTLSASAPSAGGSPNFRCYSGTIGTPGSEITGSCNLAFASSGFILDVPPHLSCKVQTLTITAVKTSDTTKKCVPAFDGGALRDIKLRFAYSDPDPATAPATTAHVPRVGSAVVDGNPGVGTALATGSDQTLTLAFTAGVATTNFLYDDAGSLTLTASYTGAAATGDAGLSMSGTTNPAIIVAPASFTLAVPAAPLTAGTPFATTVTARNACTTPATTTNFGKEASGNSVALSSTNPLPAQGNAATIADSVIAGGVGSPFAGTGVGTKNVTWNEVGTVDVVATLSSYQGTALPMAATGTVKAGRFKPHHLETEVTPGCSSAFTYSGQPFTVKTTAYRQGGTGATGITANYAGATWARDVAITAWSGSPLVAVPAVTGALSNGSHLATDFAAGAATRADVRFSFVGTQVPLSITLRSTESSGSDGVTSNGAVEGITQVRSGRLWLGNAFGSEFLTLRMPMQTQYWTATGWQKNTADSCTQLTVPTSGNGGLVFGTQTTVNQLTVGETTATMAGTPAGRVVNGDPLLSLSAPGAGNFGYVDVAAGNLGAPTWLPPTGSARACFGTCGPRRPVVIFQRGGY
jgi:MSHA biogenesis protein MshQ